MDGFDRANVLDVPLDAAQAHGGTGEIGVVRLLVRDDVAGACDFVDVAALPPGTSIGRHRHADDEEEYYLVLSGRGVMVRDGQRLDVRAGDLVRNGPGGEHELHNLGPGELRIFVFQLQVAP